MHTAIRLAVLVLMTPIILIGIALVILLFLPVLFVLSIGAALDYAFGVRSASV